MISSKLELSGSKKECRWGNPGMISIILVLVSPNISDSLKMKIPLSLRQDCVTLVILAENKNSLSVRHKQSVPHV